MPLTIICSNCRLELQIPDHYLGKLVRCPSCKTEISKRALFSENSPAPLPQIEPLTFPPRERAGAREDDWSERPRPRSAGAQKPASNFHRVIIGLGIAAFAVIMFMFFHRDTGTPKKQAFVGVKNQPFPNEEDRFGEMVPRMPNGFNIEEPPFGEQDAEADLQFALDDIHRRQFGLGVQRFKKALARLNDPLRRPKFLRDFMREMASANRTMEAYTALDDSREAFRYLAEELKYLYQMDDLRQLVYVHGKKQPADPFLPFYQAEVEVFDGFWDRADKSFNLGMARPLRNGPVVPVEIFRLSRVRARYHVGAGLDAYRQIGPANDTFLQLAALCLQDRNYALLETLLNEHGRHNPWNHQVHIHRMSMLIDQGKFTAAVKIFTAALKLPTDNSTRSQIIWHFVSNMAEAGKALDAYRAVPAADADQALRTLTELLIGSGDAANLRLLLDEHRRRLPDDPLLIVCTGRLLMLEKSWKEAARYLDKNWSNAPVEIRPYYTEAMYRAGRGLEVYRVLQRNFEQLADLMVADKKGAELEELIAAHRGNALEQGDVDFRRAQAKLLLNRSAQAIPFFTAAYHAELNADRRRTFLARFVLAMLDADRAMQIYRAAPNQTETFEILAREILARKNGKLLEQLLGEHGAAHGADPLYHYYRGQLHLLRHELGRALGHFAEGLRDDSFDRDQYRRAHNLVRIRLGQTVRAYNESGRRLRTFLELAQLCAAEKNAGELAALVKAFHHDEFRDVMLPAWELEIKWLHQDWEGVLQFIARHRQGAPRQFTDRAANYKVRCLLKLKRTDEALRAAQAVTEPVRGLHKQLLLVLVQASKGDVKKTIIAVDKARDRSWLLSDCYRDADLGSILRSEPFREFRQRFPETVQVGNNIE